MKNTYLNNTIEEFGLSKDKKEKLKENNINLVSDIWVLNRKKLKEFGLSDSDINQIIIKLQLNGLDLNKKSYKNK